MNAGKRFDCVRTHKATVVAKCVTYSALYCVYCAIISAVIYASEAAGVSEAVTNTLCVMTGYTAYLSFTTIKKKIIQPMIDSITTALV